MSDYSLAGPPPIPLVLRRSGRARRISLRVSQLDGRVTLTLPKGIGEAEALEFARSKEGWIRGHLDARQSDIPIALGARLPIEGRLRRIVPGPGRRVILHPTEIAVPPGPEGRRLQGFLRELARDRLTAASDAHARTLGLPFARLTLRDPRSRWGSCSSAGALMYSWRLVMAPPEVLNYVAAHEVAHLAEMNHSASFWAVVERLFGPHAEPRKWLREHGAALHRYRF